MTKHLYLRILAVAAAWIVAVAAGCGTQSADAPQQAIAVTGGAIVIDGQPGDVYLLVWRADGTITTQDLTRPNSPTPGPDVPARPPLPTVPAPAPAEPPPVVPPDPLVPTGQRWVILIADQLTTVQAAQLSLLKAQMELLPDPPKMVRANRLGYTQDGVQIQSLIKWAQQIPPEASLPFVFVTLEQPDSAVRVLGQGEFRGAAQVLGYLDGVPSDDVDAVIYVYERDQGGIPPGVLAGLKQINAEHPAIMAVPFEDDQTTGDDQVPDRYKVAVDYARTAGLPELVILAGGKVVKTVEATKIEDVTGVLP